MNISRSISLLKETYTEWSNHQATRFGASVAFYSLLSFAPLLVIIAAVLALAFDRSHSQAALVGYAQQMMGPRGAESVKSLLANAQKPASGAFASIVAFVTLLFGASGVFNELHEALNAMWDVKVPASAGWLQMIKDRLLSFGMVLAIGFLLLVSLLLSAALALVGKFFGNLVPVPEVILQIVNFVISFAVITALFALMFKFLPSTKISWRDVGIGAVGTALLFTIGKILLGLYLGKASVGSTYGAAGSLVAVIVWVYYSAQIFFFGAEFTHVYAEARSGAKTAKEPAESQPVRPRPDIQPSPAPLFPPDAVKPLPAIVPAAARVAVASSPLPVSAASLPSRAKPLGYPATHSSPKSKPKLLMAVGLGFLLARLITKNGPRKHLHGFTV